MVFFFLRKISCRFVFGCAGPSLLPRGSLVAAHSPQAGVSSCSPRASAAPRHMGSSQTRDRTHLPCTGRRLHTHCATREVPCVFFSKFSMTVSVFSLESFAHLHLKVKVEVAQSCLMLCDPVDYAVHGVLQARTLGRVAFPFSRGSSQARDQTGVSCIVSRFFTS